MTRKPREPKATAPAEPVAEPPKLGRPSEYSEDVVSAILARMMKGESLRQICRDEEMPTRSTIYEWLAKEEYQSFSDRYARAREIQADEAFDEMAEIADDGSNDWMEIVGKEGDTVGWRINGEAVQRSKLRLDERKWRLAKMLPKKYGDKTTLVGGDPETDDPIQIDDSRDMARKIAVLLTGALSAQSE